MRAAVLPARGAALATALLLAGCGRARPIAGSLEQCDTCHGSPPASGAHVVHVAGGVLGPPVPCATCHVVPAEAGHPDGRLQVTFGAFATHGGAAAPAWDGARCAGTYCHGGTLRGGTNTAPAWKGGGGEAACGSCHGLPPPSPHPTTSSGCGNCHAGYTPTTVNLAVHLNGVIDGPSGAACGDCHAIPPATGAHLVHATPASPASRAYGSTHALEDVAPAGAPAYDFGCGSCHPLDPAQHFEHVAPDVGGARVPDVFLDPAAAPTGSLRARNLPGARFDPVTRTCSGVACHSSGRDPSVLTSTEYVTTPPWDGPPGALGCAGCHANPPRYPSGGAGAPDANSHLVLADDGWESGHFQGLPGYWHTSKHGGNRPGEDAAPITCQTCHAETVDPTAAGPSGFYWLDTTGDYQLPGSAADAAYRDRLRCESCHDRTLAATARGRVLPLRHVNGRRDVVFDPRTAVSAIAWLPGPPSTPTRPYWVTDGAPGVTIPDPAIPDAVFDGTTLSLHLASARYDPATKTCTSVACHLAQTSVTWGAPHGWAACGTCHGF